MIQASDGDDTSKNNNFFKNKQEKKGKIRETALKIYL